MGLRRQLCRETKNDGCWVAKHKTLVADFHDSKQQSIKSTFGSGVPWRENLFFVFGSASRVQIHVSI